MITVEIDEFRMFPDGVLVRANRNPVTIRENGRHLAVMIPPDLYDLYVLFEAEHWKRPKDERPNITPRQL